MRFDIESWRKLYVAESVEHKLKPILSRGFRDYLIRHARADGTLLAKTADPCGDLARALGAHPDEFGTVKQYIQDWIDDGYLRFSRGRLAIARFVEAQEARSPGALRQKRYVERKRTHETVT